MFKFAVVIFAVLACAAAKPGLVAAPLAYTAPAAVVAAPAPLVAAPAPVVAAPAPVVTAASSQFIARNYNGIASSPVFAPVASPLIAKTFAAYTSPIAAAAYTAPLAYSAPVVAKKVAAYSPLLVHSAPLTYAAAAPAPVLL